jgi:hypothetical protein
MTNTFLLKDTSIYGFGDSLVAGHYNGIGMLDYLTEKNHMKYYKYAINGATVIPREPYALPDMEGLVYDIGAQIDRAPVDVPDFICFDGLTNDAYDDIKNRIGILGKGYDGNYDTSTFLGAFETICYKLRLKYQNSKIIYICPHKMPTRTDFAQETLQNCVRLACEKWSIPYVDIYRKGGINTYIDGMRTTYSYNKRFEQDNGNGTHLNEKGYQLWYTPMIESMLLQSNGNY